MAGPAQQGAPERIEVLSAALADQIAAGEVVERPGSVVKELVENAVDAGATRIDVELVGAGMKSIRVIDDGRGMLPEDLPLAVQRHATSKIRTADELVEIRTLGFRGEALASISAVARTTIKSRPRGATVGHVLRVRPDAAPASEPVGMPEGTQIEVEHLFAAVPARRKFVRSDATEIGHCSDAVVRVGLVHPDVHFTLTHEGRKLLDLPRADLGGRMAQVLVRRGAGPFHEIVGEHEGVAVRAFLAPPSSASRHRKGTFIIVRRRVVSERSISQILHAIYGESLPRGTHPVAGISVEPPAGTVDVNVHPQKAEVRFSDAQAVYSAVRVILARGMETAPWRGGGEALAAPLEGDAALGVEPQGPVVGEHARRVSAAAASWDFDALSVPEAPVRRSGYRLGTRAAQPGYAGEKARMRDDVDALRRLLPPGAGGASRSTGTLTPGLASDADATSPAGEGQAERLAQPDPAVAARDPMAGLELLTCLPGPVALFVLAGDLVAVDLGGLRALLVRRRLERDLGGEGIVTQRLLTPVVVALSPADLQASVSPDGVEALRGLGVELESFGDDAVIVRGVPAHLEHCVDQSAVEALLHRLLPWLRLRRRDHDAARRDSAIDAIAAAAGDGQALERVSAGGMSTSTGVSASRRFGRLARLWVRDFLESEGLAGLLAAPCTRQHAAAALVGRRDHTENDGQ